MIRALSFCTLAGLLGACDDGADAPPAAQTVALSGHAFAFATTGGRVEGGTVTLLEFPERSAITDADGAFRFDELPADATATLVLDHPDHPPIQTGTFVLGEKDVERVTFQAPDHATYDLLANVLRLEPDPTRCQIATTVTRMGNSLYDEIPGTHGEPGATVTLDPMPEGVDGPVYFDLVRYNVIFPARALTETSADGGVLFLDVPPGTYTLRAHKADTTFTEAIIECRAGLLVNASPPWGLQAIEGGVGPRTEPDWQ